MDGSEASPLLGTRSRPATGNNTTLAKILSFVFVAFLGVLVGIIASRPESAGIETISVEALDHGLALCASLKAKHATPPTSGPRKSNPRYSLANQTTSGLLLQNSRLFNGNASLWENVDVFVHKGLILQVRENLILTEIALEAGVHPDEVVVIDLKGKRDIRLTARTVLDSWSG